MYWIYIIKSDKNGRYYIGCTNNILRRIVEHNKKLSRYTKSGGSWKLVYQEEYSTLTLARRREKQIKSWKKRVAIEKLIKGAFV